MKALGIAVAWAFAFLAVGLALGQVLNALIPDTDSPWWLAREGAIHTTAFGLATWFIGRRLNHRTWGAMGWREGQVSGGFVLGVVSGAAMAGLAVGLAVVASGARVHFWTPGSGLPAGGPLVAGMLSAALAEELLFRGYPLRRLSDAVGKGRAVALSAFVFGLAHLANPEATVFGVVNIALAGVWLSLAFFSPGGMPLAWGVHFGWNAALAELFHAPVSGYVFPSPGAHYSPGHYSWLDGGMFGPEGGVVGTVAILAGVVLLWSTGRVRLEPAA